MSHFTKCALKMTNLAAIKKALADMELKFVEAEQGQTVQVRGYRGDKLQAAISVDMGRYDVGVVDNLDGTFDINADWGGGGAHEQGGFRGRVQGPAQPALPVPQRQASLRRQGLCGRRGSERGGRIDP